MIWIGIDTGRHTGFAAWDGRRLVAVRTVTITQAIELVRGYMRQGPVQLRIEDARQRRWFGATGRERLKGAGSVCRDASIWEDWCVEQDIPYELVAPRDNRTKLSALQFRNLTGWLARTTEHGRDAAMLVYGMSKGK
jgi:hypothetical protein